MLTSGNIFTLVVAVVFILVFITGIRGILASFTLQKKYDALAASGVTTQAKITHLGKVGMTAQEEMNSSYQNVYGRPAYFVTYAFSAPGSDGAPKSYSRHLAVGAKGYNQLKVGDEITVAYLPDNPHQSKIQSGLSEARTPATMRLWGVAEIALSLIAGIYMAVTLLRR